MKTRCTPVFEIDGGAVVECKLGVTEDSLPVAHTMLNNDLVDQHKV